MTRNIYGTKMIRNDVALTGLVDFKLIHVPRIPSAAADFILGYWYVVLSGHEVTELMPTYGQHEM
jgi:hypothetical protein